MTLDAEYFRLIMWITAALAMVGSFALLYRPAPTALALKAFPRNKTAGWLLTGIALVWAALMINDMTLGEMSRYKPYLVVLTPIAFFLIVRYLDELLASRAVGGILLLYPNLLVDTARWSPSPFRLLAVTLGYVLVIAGIWLVLSPHKFRIWSEWLMNTPSRKQTSGAVLAVLAGSLLFAGFTG